jgi:hypothetical protein
LDADAPLHNDIAGVSVDAQMLAIPGRGMAGAVERIENWRRSGLIHRDIYA